jgi:hypothetical protein
MKNKFCGSRTSAIPQFPIYIQQDATLHSLFHLETALQDEAQTALFKDPVRTAL